MDFISLNFGTITAILTQLVIYTAWIVRIDSRVRFLQKRNTELSDRIGDVSQKSDQKIKQLESKTEQEVKQLEGKLDQIFKELAEVNKKLAVIIDRQERRV